MDFLIYASIACISALVTHEFSKKRNIGAVRASAIYTLVTTAILYSIHSSSPLAGLANYEGLIFGGAFVGTVCATKYNRIMITIGGLILALIFFFIRPHTYGYGGAIGTSAFVSCMSIYLLRALLLKSKPIILRNRI
ncbi:hypothetical protein A9Q84_15795 [Halobacteriovorax marinus]|uniref:Uncharacterized protein n=1 Tax=Halobacteriovorax marinus TaxID=97084 RepID=A0A1Y5F7Y0_9BACT|nr:hypothetical protein A9Q84_15795 [Halobacteriovorax marinus]